MICQLLPSEYQDQEINRLTIAYFVVSGLHILGAFEFACGFSKFPRQLPDLYGFSAVSLLEEPGVNPICVELGITDVDAIGI